MNETMRSMVITLVLGGCSFVLLYYAQQVAEYVSFANRHMVAGTAFVLFVVSIAHAFHKTISTSRLMYEFITVATHKFRTPLTQMRWALESLNKTHVPSNLTAAMGQIKVANKRLIDVVDAIVGFAHVDQQTKLHAQTASFREMVESAIKKFGPLVNKKNISMRVDIDDIPLITADLQRLYFVIEILIQNAITYTPTGGSIAISAFKKGRKVVLSVADTGIGFTRKERRLIFKKFYRTVLAKQVDTEGMGLGLAMSHRIIKQHNGTLEASSDGHHKGAVFTMSLPIIT